MEPSPAPRELIVVAEPEVGLRATPEGLFSASGLPLNSLEALLSSADAWLEPLFGISEDLLEFKISLEVAESVAVPTNWSRYYKVAAPDSKLETLAQQLRDDPAVHAAFLKPGVELPLFLGGGPPPLTPGPSEVTPDFSGSQIYLDQPEPGINAIAAWERPGGGGLGTQIIDIEGAWRFTHEDLKENQGGLVGGTQSPDLLWRNHGTAVLGIISGDRNNGNNFGIIGICPEANVRGVSVFGQPSSQLPSDSGTAAAIRQAADLLRSGDIMVLELQLPGPTMNFEIREDQQGYIPVEWWPDNLAAIQYAVARGIIVVEAAANGGSNLDDEIFNHSPAPPHGPFPADWRNPFSRTCIDSGAIVVGAGAPQRLLNHFDFGPDRSRLDFSNFGSLVDAQGWGHDVTTCGFSNIQGIDEDRFYTNAFGGTSAATPMVAGALASLQGVLRAAGKALLTPARARELLRTTGSPQNDADPGANRPASQRIGNRPDILEMINELGL